MAKEVMMLGVQKTRRAYPISLAMTEETDLSLREFTFEKRLEERYVKTAKTYTEAVAMFITLLVKPK